MEKISISNIVAFRKKSTASQITLVNNLKKPKPPTKDENGGNYWVHSLSVVSNAFKTCTNEEILEKADIVSEKKHASQNKQSKIMFQKNIDVLLRFEEYDFSKLRPEGDLQYFKKPKDISILNIEGLPIQVLPHHVYSFEEKGIKKIGSSWFVAKKDGYRQEELAIFTDASYRYLKTNYGEKYEVSPQFCLTIDVMNLNLSPYTQILEGKVNPLLDSTLEFMKTLF